MEPQNNMNMPPQPGMGSDMGGAKSSSAGPVIGVVIILAIIILGALYFWGQRGAPEDTTLESDETTQSIDSQSSSDDLNSIEADLDSTDIENLDAEINAS